MEKKEKEREVLDQVLERARRRGGESRRNVDRISGCVHEGERPDFLIVHNGSGGRSQSVVAVEHFRVDHFSEENKRGGHQDSIAVIEERRADEVQEKWDAPEDVQDASRGFISAIGESFARCIQAKVRSCYADYLRSFTYGLEKHARNLGCYCESAALLAGDGDSAKTAFLIELHSDFTVCFVHDGRGGCRKAISGELLMFDEMAAQLRQLRETVDYVLLGSYPSLSGSIVDAVVVRTCMLDEGFKRGKVPIYRYIGEDKDRSIYGGASVSLLSFSVGDKIDFSLQREGREMSLAEHSNACLECLPKVIRANKENVPFVTTLGMQMLLEFFGDVLSNRPSLCERDIVWAIRKLGPEELERRRRAFDERWGFAECGLDGVPMRQVDE